MLQRWLGPSLTERKTAPAPNIRLLVGSFVLFTLAYLVVSLAIVPGGEARQFNFDDERGSVTALSAIYLAMAAALAIAAAWLPTAVGSPSSLGRASGLANPSTVVFLVLAAGFAFFALDELLQGHERVGRFLEGQVGDPPGARKWNDVIVAAYGLVAIPVLLWLLPRMLRFRTFPVLLAIAIGCYGMHTLVDSTTEPPTTTSTVIEESFKAFSSGFAALAMFAALLSVFAMVRGGTPTRLATSSAPRGST